MKKPQDRNNFCPCSRGVFDEFFRKKGNQWGLDCWADQLSRCWGIRGAEEMIQDDEGTERQANVSGQIGLIQPWDSCNDNHQNALNQPHQRSKLAPWQLRGDSRKVLTESKAEDGEIERLLLLPPVSWVIQSDADDHVAPPPPAAAAACGSCDVGRVHRRACCPRSEWPAWTASAAAGKAAREEETRCRVHQRRALPSHFPALSLSLSPASPREPFRIRIRGGYLYIHLFGLLKDMPSLTVGDVRSAQTTGSNADGPRRNSGDLWIGGLSRSLPDLESDIFQQGNLIFLWTKMEKKHKPISHLPEKSEIR